MFRLHPSVASGSLKSMNSLPSGNAATNSSFDTSARRQRDCGKPVAVIDLDHWPAWGRLLFKALGGHAGDNRQWPDIDAWAEKISHETRVHD